MQALSTTARPRIGWGLIGAGGISDQLARALSYVPEARLVAVGSRDVAKAQAFIDAPRQHEAIHEPVRAHGSYQALADDPDVDVVYIGTPHPDHLESMRMALAAGKAVLCEKPFTLNRREAEEAVALARRHGGFLMEAMWMRYVPARVELKRLVAGGAIGEPVAVSADFGFSAAGLPATHRALARRRDVFLMEAMWMRYVPAMVELRRLVAEGAIGEPVAVSADFGFSAAGLPVTHRALAPELGGGGLLDIGIYPLNFAAFVLGPIAKVQAAAELGPTGVDLHTVFNLRHTSGCLSQGMCSLRTTTACAATVMGTAGRIEITPPFYAAQQLRVYRGSMPPEEAPVEVIDKPWRGNRYVGQIEEVHRCLRAGLAESPSMTLDESVALVGWMDTMRAQFGLRYPGE